MKEPAFMAGSSLLTLIDDIATLLDDISVMTKVAAHKTAGVLGDDLALNAEQVTGVRAERELPVVWAVAKGSLLNKLILIPTALLISAFIPWAITPLLMLGGAFLCFEGFEKIIHPWLHPHESEDHVEAAGDTSLDLVQYEKDKIKGAVRTDFILSAEIITITLGTVENAPLLQQALVLIGIGFIMTIGVYGLVGGIVKMDDLGFYLVKKDNPLLVRLGKIVLAAAPLLMKTLSVVGTAAMFLVGGGIIVHGADQLLPVLHLHHMMESFVHFLAGIPLLGNLLKHLGEMTFNGIIGLLSGAIIVACFTLLGKGFKQSKSAH
jgi:uncharacterized protein